MFCIKCGATLEDGAKFCPQCGASQAPAPAASAAGTPAQPHRSSTDRMQAQQPVYQQPQQPVYQQPQQPVYQQPYQAPPAPPPKKKKHTGLIVVLVLILAVAAAGFLLRNKISAFVLRSVGPAEKYYEHVEKQSITELSANASEAYDVLFLSNVSDVDNQTTEGGVELHLGSAGRDLIMAAAGDMIKQLNPSEDLAWLQTLGIDTNVVTQGDKKSLGLALKLNGVGLVTLNMVADTANDKAYIAIPELKKEYLEMPLSQLGEMSGSGPMQIIGMLGGLAGTDNKQLADAMKGMPSKSQVESLLKKYLDMFIESADKVEKEKDTLTVEGVSVEVTVLEITADGEDVARAMTSILTEMKKDQDVKSIILSMSEAQEQDGEEAYKEFVESLDRALEDMDDLKESTGYTMTVYTDAGGEVVGREFRTESFAYIMKKPEAGGKFGLELQIGEENSALTLKGSGTKSGDKLTGELDIEVAGSFVGVLALDKFDEEKMKQGMLSGAVELRPSDALLSSAGSGSMLSSVLRNLVLRLEMDTGREKADVSLIIQSDGSELMTISGKVNSKSGGKVSSVTGEDMEKWSSEMDTESFLATLVKSLEKAKVPEAYTSMIPVGD